GGGTDGVSDDQYAALRDVRAWQRNNAVELSAVLMTGVNVMGNKAMEMAVGPLTSAAKDALGTAAKKLISTWLGSTAGGALLNKAIEEAGRGIPDARAKLEREVFSTVLGWYIKQLKNPDLRRGLAPLAKLGGDKPLDKALLAALVNMIVDPMLSTL